MLGSESVKLIYVETWYIKLEIFNVSSSNLELKTSAKCYCGAWRLFQLIKTKKFRSRQGGVIFLNQNPHNGYHFPLKIMQRDFYPLGPLILTTFRRPTAIFFPHYLQINWRISQLCIRSWFFIFWLLEENCFHFQDAIESFYGERHFYSVACTSNQTRNSNWKANSSANNDGVHEKSWMKYPFLYIKL